MTGPHDGFFYLARCHHCHEPDWPVPFGSREKRDEWVGEHRLACRNAITTWKEVRHDRTDAP